MGLVRNAVMFLFGEKAGRVIVGWWSWLIGQPVQEGGQVAVEVAEQSIISMKQALQELTQAVATQVAAYQRAQQKYAEKVKEYKTYEQQAATAQRNGNTEAARLAMGRLLQIEGVLPGMAEQVKQAETFVAKAKDKLARQQQQLEDYRTQLDNMKDISEINEALAQMAKVNDSYSIDSARSQFDAAKNAVERKNLRVSAQLDLSENPADALSKQLDDMVQGDAIEQRLAQLAAGNSSPLNLPLSNKESIHE